MPVDKVPKTPHNVLLQSRHFSNSVLKTITQPDSLHDGAISDDPVTYRQGSCLRAVGMKQGQESHTLTFHAELPGHLESNNSCCRIPPDIIWPPRLERPNGLDIASRNVF